MYNIFYYISLGKGFHFGLRKNLSLFLLVASFGLAFTLD